MGPIMVHPGTAVQVQNTKRRQLSEKDVIGHVAVRRWAYVAVQVASSRWRAPWRIMYATE